MTGLAERFRSQGVVGVDIASGEMHFEPGSPLLQAHKVCTDAAKVAGFGVTVHAAESGPAENVETSIVEYSAARIGHGYRCFGCSAYEVAKSKRAHFELCPTSSVATQGVDIGEDWSSHPLRRICADRCSCSVSTDDPTVFRTSLTEELVKCVTLIGIDLADVEWMTLQGLKAAFNLSEEIRLALEARITAYYDEAIRKGAAS
eukprot:gnl/TRDRNA2_/TRDRNA2_151386_c0_seq2.p1 gnl/TRDRNA2_/TRDRNA2_151386_c0~~gnl/TRDRNA2_/TRDRNA2_151386_c0_seq2.p1  ORF type:complete len:218 (+),score=35.61 gnl/TRDRNA2_/TRDRNA2_151386_c0_seq2:48-656(+)